MPPRRQIRSRSRQKKCACVADEKKPNAPFCTLTFYEFTVPREIPLDYFARCVLECASARATKPFPSSEYGNVKLIPIWFYCHVNVTALTTFGEFPLRVGDQLSRKTESATVPRTAPHKPLPTRFTFVGWCSAVVIVISVTQLPLGVDLVPLSALSSRPAFRFYRSHSWRKSKMFCLRIWRDKRRRHRWINCRRRRFEYAWARVPSAETYSAINLLLICCARILKNDLI